MPHFDHSKENVERRKQGLPELYCPFGCNGTQVSSGQSGAAYCCHLVGFTLDEGNRIFETLTTTPWGNGEFFSTTSRGKQRVQPTDIVINPLVKQVLTTGVHWAKKWLTARVYRACTPTEAEAWRKRWCKDVDAELMAELAEDDRETRIRALKAELADLEGGEPVNQPIEAQDDDLTVEVPLWGPPQAGEPGVTDELRSSDPRAEQTPMSAGGEISDDELEALTAPIGAR